MDMYMEINGEQIDFDIAPRPEDRDTICPFVVDGRLVGTAHFGTLESWYHVGRYGGLPALLAEFVTLTPYGKSLMHPDDARAWERGKAWEEDQRRVRAWMAEPDDEEEYVATPSGGSILPFLFVVVVVLAVLFVGGWL